MGTSGQEPVRATGEDILVRYLQAYAHARQMSEWERPWGLDPESFDDLWRRLTKARAQDTQALDHFIDEELKAEERERLIQALAPLLFAMPVRSYPAELRALRVGSRLLISLRHLHGLEDSAGQSAIVPEEAAPKARAGRAREQAVGFLPASLTQPLSVHLRRVLRFGAGEQEREVTVSSGGRRRRVRVTLLAHERGVLIRFLHRLSSAADEGH